MTGLTLVELLVTVLLLSVVASAVLPIVHVTNQRAKETELRRSLRDLRAAIDAYKRAVDEGRIAKNADESGYPRTLDDLVRGVPNAKVPGGPRMYFMRRIPRDPLAEESVTDSVQSWGKRSYESGPNDPKEGADVFDVYSKSVKVGVNRIPYREW